MRLGLGHGLDTGFNVPLLGNNFLLDTYSGAAAAFSLRKLSASTTNVVRVRRSSDNAEADFTDAEVSDGTLTTWTGANDGFVVTWYDQSGNGNDATQSTASNQPLIVSGGVLVLENGLPALDFDGVDDRLNAGDNLDLGTNDMSVFATLKQTLNNDSAIISKYSTLIADGYYLYHQNLNKSRILLRDSNTDISTGTNLTDVTIQNISTFIADRSNLSQAFVNGTFVDDANISSFDGNAIENSIDFYIGYAFSFTGRYYGGFMQEILVYLNDQSANRNSIESDINSHYSIY